MMAERKKHLLTIIIMFIAIFTWICVEGLSAINAYALTASNIHFVTGGGDQEYRIEETDAEKGEYNLLVPDSMFTVSRGKFAYVKVKSSTTLYYSTNDTKYTKLEANGNIGISATKSVKNGGKLYIKSDENNTNADYIYTVVKCASLTSLSVDGREISPSYSWDNDTYTTAVISESETITVNVGTSTATSRTIKVNGSDVTLAKGKGSIELNLSKLDWSNSRTSVSIVVSDTELNEGSTYNLNIECNPQVRIFSQSENIDKAYYDNEANPSSMSISAVAPNEISYQWFVSENQNLSAAVAIEGATNKEYTPDIQRIGTNSETRYYYCEARNTVGEEAYTAKSHAWKVTINRGVYPIVSISSPDGIQNNTVSVTAREDKVTLEAEATLPSGYTANQGDLTYQWYIARTNEDVPATNGKSQSLECYSSGDSVNSYYCCVTYTHDGEKFTTKTDPIKVSVFGFKENFIEYRANQFGYKDITVKVGKSAKAGITVSNCVGGKLYAQWFASSDGESYTQMSELEQYQNGTEITLNSPIKSEESKDYYYCRLVYEMDSVAKPGETVRTERTTTPITVTTEGLDKLEGFDGEGTIDNPFLIKCIDDLQNLKSKVNTDGYTCYGVYFRLEDNITIPAKNWTPIGTNNAFFSGHIDGNGKTLTIEENGKPLLGYVREASVSNLNLFGKKINGYGLVDNYVVDKATKETIRITNVTIKEGTNIVKSGFIGGYASGVNNVYITNCRIEKGVVVGCNKNLDNIGGFAGEFNGYIINCVNEGDVYGKNFVGGIIADKGQCMGFCQIRNCTFSGKVVATGNYVGGISGGGYGGTTWGVESGPNTPCITIQNCISTGSISGKNYVGGILGAEPGVVQCWENGKAYVTDNLFIGAVSATDANAYVGGIIGYFNSINKYTTISNNYFADSCGANKGIGQIMVIDTSCEAVDKTDSTVKYMNTSAYATYSELRNAAKEIGYEGFERFQHNRTDDPLGTDADSLTKKVSTTELKDGTVSNLLNSTTTSFKNWVQGTESPMHSDEPVLYAIEISGDYKTEYKTGDSFSTEGMVITGTMSDGSTKNISLKDEKLKFSGFNSNQRSVQTITVTYGVASTTYEIRVLYNESKTKEIVAYFTLLGDSSHDEATASGGPHTLASGNLKTWVSRTKVTITNNTSVYDVFQKVLKDNGIEWEGSDDNQYSTMYISGVKIPGSSEYLSEFSNGNKSGWMYTLNGSHPTLGVAQQFLSNGDEIVFHYTDDYTVEEGSDKWDTTGTTGSTTETVTTVTTDTKKDTTTTPTEVKVTEKTTTDGTKEKVATVTVTTANQKELLKQAKANKSKEVVLQVAKDSMKDASKAEVQLDKSFVNSILNDTDATVTVETPLGNKTYTQDELKNLVASATGSTITLTVDKSDASVDTTDELDVKAEVAKLTPVARSSKTAKKNIKVTTSLDKNDKAIIAELKDAGYTVKYRFYRSTKKASRYKAKLTGTTGKYTNTIGKAGTRYYYKVQLRVYDKDGKLVAKTALKQCKYATRIFG